MSRRVLGLDVGERRIGIALSDPLGMTAQGLTVLKRRGLASDVDAVGGLVAQYNVERIVLGLPLTLGGERGRQAQKVETFAQALQHRIAVPVQLIDERLTTAQSERVLLEADVSRRKRKRVIDQLAAQLILQQYLDGQRDHDTS